jgi:hypothetical protein
MRVLNANDSPYPTIGGVATARLDDVTSVIGDVQVSMEPLSLHTTTSSSVVHKRALRTRR